MKYFKSILHVDFVLIFFFALYSINLKNEYFEVNFFF